MGQNETEEKPGAGEPGKKTGEPTESAWPGLLKGAAKEVIPVLLTAGTLIGFVAFAGAVIVWTRLYAIEVPPDQAVKAVPRDELVATGSSLLLLFGFFGVLAIVAAYLIDRGARATPGMSRTLLVLLAIEGVTAIATFGDGWDKATLGAILVFLALVVIALAATFEERVARYEDVLPAGPEESLPAYRGPGPMRKADGTARVSPQHSRAAAARLVAFLALVATLAFAEPDGWVAVVLLVLTAIVALRLARSLWVVGRTIRESEKAERPRGARGTVVEGEERLRRHRPHRLVMTPSGAFFLGILAAAAVALPCLLLREWWLAVPLAVAMVLGVGVWRIAVLSRLTFMWYGFAVFLSVPLFGTFNLMAHNIADPQVQPVAMIRNTDGPDESIQGIYVTEGSDRVYFANLATEGCGNDVKGNSGRLLWVPKDEVVAMSIGPLQDVDDAGKTALEMAYALTPDVETPAGDRVSLTVAEKRSKKVEEAEETREAKEAEAHPSGLNQRLADPGPAVRPDFGSGLTLVPETASPGEAIELRLSVPNEDEDVEGFGPTPAGHTLRLGGVPVSILRAGTRQAFDAEYVKTTDGRVLRLDKQGVYRLREGVPELLVDERGHEGRRFVRLEDSRVERIRGGLKGDGAYLRVAGNGRAARLAGAPQVKLVGEDDFVALDGRFLRQAWERDRIRFRVPENASTGVVTVECGQLAGQPLLRVSRPPTARIAVHMQAGSGRVRLDSRRSSDDGKIESRRWTIGGLPRGKETQISRMLPPRLAAYRVQLTVTDEDEESDTAELRLLRLPASFFRFAEDRPERARAVRRIRSAVVREASEEPPAAIEIDGHADDVGSRSYNVDLSWRRAANVGKALRATSRATASSAAVPPLPVKTRGFGESCPVDPGSGRSHRNRRVEVFILGPGTRVVFPHSCRPGRTARANW